MLQPKRTKFRKQQEKGEFPVNFMRHYYDVYRLLKRPEVDGKRVCDWIRWFESTCASALPPTKKDDALLGALLERNFLVTSSNLVCRRDFLLRTAAQWRDLEFCETGRTPLRHDFC